MSRIIMEMLYKRSESSRLSTAAGENGTVPDTAAPEARATCFVAPAFWGWRASATALAPSPRRRAIRAQNRSLVVSAIAPDSAV
jgi:hypothetical protein